MQCTTYNNNIIPQTRYTIRAREGGSATVVTARDSERERERQLPRRGRALSIIYLFFHNCIPFQHAHTHDDARTQAHNKSHTQAGRNSRARRAIRSLYWGCCCSRCCWCFCCFFFHSQVSLRKLVQLKCCFCLFGLLLMLN